MPLLTIHSFVTENLVYYSWGKQITLNSLDYIIYSSYLILCFSIALIAMYKRSKTKDSVYSIQSYFFAFGFFIASLFGLLFNLLLPGLGNYRLIWIGPLFTGLLTVVIAYSIVRHRMFDIRPVIARSISYAASILILAAIYGFVVFGVTSRIFKYNINSYDQIYLSIATGAVALSFHRIRLKFDKLTRRIFSLDTLSKSAIK